MSKEEFPSITFVLTTLSSQDDHYLATGDITLHGQTHPISFPVSITREESTETVTGEVVIDHREFGLKQFRKFGFLTVSPEVKVVFTIVGKAS